MTLDVNKRESTECISMHWSYGVVVAHRTLNPTTRVRISVRPILLYFAAIYYYFYHFYYH